MHQYNSNDMIRLYNSSVVPELESMGIIINDLYSVVEPNVDTFIRKDDYIHLTQTGIDACAKHVASFIKDVDD